MARPLRVVVAGGWYHVAARGTERRTIFGDEREHAHFVELLAAMVERYGVRLHAYVLMGNHYHLLVQAPRGNLSRAMQWLNVSYGVWFNRRRGRVGPLFQGRFKAVPIEAVEWEKQEGWMAFRDRYGDDGRDLALWLGRRHGGMTLGELGAAAGGVSAAAVSEAIRRLDRQLPQEAGLRRMLARLETDPRELENDG